MSASPANRRSTRPATAAANGAQRAPRPARATGARRPPPAARGNGGRSGSSRTSARARARARGRARRRALVLLLTVVVSGAAATVVVPKLHHAVQEITLPLKHEDIIRQQARDKGLDPSLIAAVIYAESHFRDGQRSSAGALGLMQLTPDTAKDIARKSGGSSFGIADLATPQVNISYGAYYLRYLKRRFDGNPTLMLAAYNAGEGNVERWLDEAVAAERDFTADDIPFPETRAYVERVLSAQRDYRAHYAAELGLHR